MHEASPTLITEANFCPASSETQGSRSQLTHDTLASRIPPLPPDGSLDGQGFDETVIGGQGDSA